jgi:hypothetical protein
MPQLIACGGRNAAFKDFSTAHFSAAKTDYVAMIVDSEYPVKDMDKTWVHLKERDGWDQPIGTTDDQVLLMVTCMETWIATDRPVLKKHYGSQLKEDALPPLIDLEERDRKSVHDSLCRATSECKNTYEKGKRSFEVIGLLNPSELRKYLKSFERLEKTLKNKL